MSCLRARRARPCRGRSAVGIAAALAVLASACSSGSSSARPSTTTTSTTTPRRVAVDGTLAIGQLAPLTGPVASLAPSFITPVKLAVDEMNLDGGVNGHPVALTVADDASSVPTARANLASLRDTNHVDAVIGPSSSEVAAALIPELARDHLLMCSGSTTAGALSSLDSGGYYFRTAPPDRLQARALARLVTADGHTRPAVLASSDTDPAFVRQVVRAFTARRARPVTIAPGAAADAARLGPALARTTPDAIVLLGFPDGVAPFLKALVAVGKGPQQIPTYGSDGLQSADLGAAVDPANPAVVAGMRGTTPSGAPPGVDHPFNARMLAAGVTPFFSASAYDCTIIVGLAATAARSDDADRIRRFVARVLTGTTPCTTFHDCATLLQQRRSIHYQGAFSTYDRWQRFEPGTGTYEVWTLGIDARPVLGPAGTEIRVP
ncbi:MAG: ABC transporter substrate-binding protein [Acidimicrobiia bacterium]